MFKNVLQKYRWALVVGGIVVVFFIALSVGNKTSGGPPTIKSVEPAGGTTIGVYPTFKITFDRTPTQDQKGRFSIVLTPETALLSSWQDTALTLAPTRVLDPGVRYVLSVVFEQNPLATLNYTTVPLNQLTKEEETRLQTESDYLFGQEEIKLSQEKPWLDQLPIATKEYTVVYDYDLQKIRIRLKTVFTEAQKKELLQTLAQKGIPTNNVVWIEK